MIWMWTSYCQAGQTLTSTTSTRRTAIPQEHLKWDTIITQRLIDTIMPSASCVCFPCWPLCVFVCIFKSQQINDINQDIKVTAKGTGEATLTVSQNVIVLISCCLSVCPFGIPNYFISCHTCHTESNIKMYLCLFDRWCRFITLCLKKRRVTVKSLTCQCSSLKVSWCPLSLPL